MESVVFADVSIYETKLIGEKIVYTNKFTNCICNLECNYDPQGFAVKFLVGKFFTKSIRFVGALNTQDGFEQTKIGIEVKQAASNPWFFLDIVWWKTKEKVVQKNVKANGMIQSQKMHEISEKCVRKLFQTLKFAQVSRFFSFRWSRT